MDLWNDIEKLRICRQPGTRCQSLSFELGLPSIGLQNNTQYLEPAAASVGLRINKDKTKILTMNTIHRQLRWRMVLVMKSNYIPAKCSK